MPYAAVAAVRKLRCAVFFFPTGKCRDHRDHLIAAHTGLVNKLIVADAGIGVPHLHNAVEDILPVVSLVKGQVKFFEIFRQW